MREIARVALAKGLNQESLAASYGRVKPEKTVNGQNVREHLDRKRPQSETVRRYAEALQLTEEHLALLQGKPISTQRFAYWRDLAIDDIRASTRRFAIVSVVQHLSRGWSDDPYCERACIEAYALEICRERAGIASPSTIRSVSAAVVALIETYEMVSGSKSTLLRFADADESHTKAFVEIYGHLQILFPEPADANAFTQILLSWLSARGIDVGYRIVGATRLKAKVSIDAQRNDDGYDVDGFSPDKFKASRAEGPPRLLEHQLDKLKKARRER